MGVYIKNMTKPKKCFGCEFCKGIGGHPTDEGVNKNYVDCKRLGRVYIDELGFHPCDGFILPNCPLVDVPSSHGDLVDRDEIEVICYEDADGYHTEIKAPTVIEAEA